MKYALAKEIARPPRPAERAESPLWDASGKRAPRIPFGDGSPRKSSPSVERAAAAHAELLLESGRSKLFFGVAREIQRPAHRSESNYVKDGLAPLARSCGARRRRSRMRRGRERLGRGWRGRERGSGPIVGRRRTRWRPRRRGQRSGRRQRRASRREHGEPDGYAGAADGAGPTSHLSPKGEEPAHRARADRGGGAVGHDGDGPEASADGLDRYLDEPGSCGPL